MIHIYKRHLIIQPNTTGRKVIPGPGISDIAIALVTCPLPGCDRLCRETLSTVSLPRVYVKFVGNSFSTFLSCFLVAALARNFLVFLTGIIYLQVSLRRAFIFCIRVYKYACTPLCSFTLEFLGF